MAPLAAQATNIIANIGIIQRNFPKEGRTISLSLSAYPLSTDIVIDQYMIIRY